MTRQQRALERALRFVRACLDKPTKARRERAIIAIERAIELEHRKDVVSRAFTRIMRLARSAMLSSDRHALNASQKKCIMRIIRIASKNPSDADIKKVHELIDDNDVAVYAVGASL